MSPLSIKEIEEIIERKKWESIPEILNGFKVNISEEIAKAIYKALTEKNNGKV